MEEIKARRYTDGDETEIYEIVKKDVLTENIKDYPKEEIEHLIESHNEDLIRIRHTFFTGRFAKDHCELFGYKETMAEDLTFYP